MTKPELMIQAPDQRRQPDLVVLVPSRGRPHTVAELATAFSTTCTGNTALVFVVDHSDPQWTEYSDAVREVNRAWTETVYGSDAPYFPTMSAAIAENEPGTMVGALNEAAIFVATNDRPFAIGFMGDDHRPRTAGWDVAYLKALHDLGTGIVYGDDGYQHERLPTQCAMTTDIVRTLGFMAPPVLHHLFVDNWWLDLGQALDAIAYLPDVLVEHVHPAAGKAELDAGYERVNAPEIYHKDQSAYRDWIGNGELTTAYWALKAVGQEAHEWRLFPEGTIPEYTTPEWYEGREHAPHLEQAGHRARLMTTASLVAQAVMHLKIRQRPTSVVDLGAGDGGLLSLLGPAIDCWGYDLMPANLEAARARGVKVDYANVLEDPVLTGDVVVCTEMLEHLVDPHGFVRRLFKDERIRALVCSSPADERPGNAYEFHTWAWDMQGYRDMVTAAGWTMKRQKYVNGFQIILAVK